MEGWLPFTNSDIKETERRRGLGWEFPSPLLANGGHICGAKVVFVGGAEEATMS